MRHAKRPARCCPDLLLVKKHYKNSVVLIRAAFCTIMPDKTIDIELFSEKGSLTRLSLFAWYRDDGSTAYLTMGQAQMDIKKGEYI